MLRPLANCRTQHDLLPISFQLLAKILSDVGQTFDAVFYAELSAETREW